MLTPSDVVSQISEFKHKTLEEYIKTYLMLTGLEIQDIMLVYQDDYTGTEVRNNVWIEVRKNNRCLQ